MVKIINKLHGRFSMTTLYPCFILACINCLLCNIVQAASPGTLLTDLTPHPLVVEDSVTFDLQDNRTSQSYRIFISIPEEPAPADGYPILYITDANVIFNTVRETVRSYEKRQDNLHKTHAILVGIGYPSEQNILKLRTYDLTPPKNTSIPVPYETGGADHFYHFIQDELKPLLDHHLRINHQKQALLGHSFGGLFTLYTLIHHPDAYQAYIAASPSLWLDPEIIDKNIQQFSKKLDALTIRPTLLISAGEYEQKFAGYWKSLPQAVRLRQGLLQKQQVSRIHKACKKLAALPSLKTSCTDFQKEDHQSVIPAAIGRGVPVIFRLFDQ